MYKIVKIIVLLILISSVVFPQEIIITQSDNSTTQYSLSEIEGLTFSKNETDSIDDGNQFLLVYSSTGTQQYMLNAIDSLYFDETGSFGYVQLNDTLEQLTLTKIDSIVFGNKIDSTVYITYSGSSASVVNTLEQSGVSVTVEDADVTITSKCEIKNITYVLSGFTDDGMLKIYSDEKIELVLNNVDITNENGPAINIQTGKKTTVILNSETENFLSDGTTYAEAVNDEDQKGTFFSEGQIVFEGKGSLKINGYGEDAHALASDDYVKIESGSVYINSSVKDGIHVNDGFFMDDGFLQIASDGDGIDGGDATIEISGGEIVIENSEDDNCAMKCDSTLIISGGTIEITVDGDQSKGIKSNQDIMLMGGTININTYGGVVLEDVEFGYDPSYCTAITTDANIYIESCIITITTEGEAGRGISCDGDINITSGKLTITSSGDGAKYTNEDGEDDAYHGPCIKADGTINILDGEVILSHSGAAGKGISADGELIIGTSESIPVLNIITTGDEVTISGSSGGWGGRPGDNSGEAAEAKAISIDSSITITNGTITISSADDGIKSKYAITIDGGNINIDKSVEGIESPLLTINGGEINVKASDDALNTTYGNGDEQDDGSILTINGGYVCVSASGGDGLDSNGRLYINGGTVIVHGAQSNTEVGVDVNGTFQINGGLVVVSGSNSNMLEGPTQSSSQYSVLLKSNQQMSANTLFHVEDSDGNNLLTFAPERSYYSIIFSSSDLITGKNYTVYTGGSSTGTKTDGLYTGGSYSGGTSRKTFTISNRFTTISF